MLMYHVMIHRGHPDTKACPPTPNGLFFSPVGLRLARVRKIAYYRLYSVNPQPKIEMFLARDAFVRTNRRAIAMMCVYLSLCLGRACIVIIRSIL